MPPALTLVLVVAPPPPGPTALDVLDAFVACEAHAVPAFRGQLRRAEAGAPPEGYAVGTSPWLGAFWYRPKRFPELTRADQAGVLRSPELRAFAAGAARFSSDRRPIHRLPLAPEDLLRPGPLVVR